MTAASPERPSIDHRRLPRAKRPPSSRDQAIYVAYHTAGRTQRELADDYHLSQRRISAILQRVERWLAAGRTNFDREQLEGGRVSDTEVRSPARFGSDAAGGAAAGPSLPRRPAALDEHAPLRLERWVERARAQAIYDRAMRAFDAAPREIVTVKHGERGGKPYHEEQRRQQAASGDLLRTALRAHCEISRLAEKPPVERPQDEERAERRAKIMAWLGEMRAEAEEARKVSYRGDSTVVVGWFLDALTGEDHDHLALTVLAQEAGKRVIDDPYGRPLVRKPGHADTSGGNDQVCGKVAECGQVIGDAAPAMADGSHDSDGSICSSDTPCSGGSKGSSGSNAAATDMPQGTIREILRSRLANLDRPPRAENPPSSIGRQPSPLVEAWMEEQPPPAAKNASAMQEFYPDCR